MSAPERVLETIDFTSPEGNEFQALWRGDPRTIPKTVGIFKYPRVKGVSTQDMDIGGTLWPLNFVFDGADHDLESERFMKSIGERGLWRIVHPVKGVLNLQLLTITENIEPLTGALHTEISSEWIQPIDTIVVPSTAQVQAEVLAQIDVVAVAGSSQFETFTEQETSVEISAFKQAVNSVVSAVEGNLEKISELSADITAQMNSIKRGINDVLAVVPLDVLATFSQLQALTQLPGQVVTDITSRIEAYTEYANELFGLDADTTDAAGRNVLLVKEAALTSAVSAVSQVTATGDIISRAQAVELMDFNTQFLSDIIDNMDLGQSQFSDLPIDLQYFSQPSSFIELVEINALTLTYLQRAVFDLAVEKRIVLDIFKAPSRITIEEYGSLGENSANLVLFIESNDLHGDDINLLSPGREVVVYV